MPNFGKRQKIHHGDAECGDRENRRKGKARKGLRKMRDSRGESRGETTVAQGNNLSTKIVALPIFTMEKIVAANGVFIDDSHDPHGFCKKVLPFFDAGYLHRR